MKTLKFLLLLFITQGAFAQIKVTKLDSAAIPKFVKYKGSLDTAVRYTDKDGLHILIASVAYNTPKDTNDDSKWIDLYAYNYIISGNTAKLLWQMHDLTDHCQEDVTGEFLDNIFSVTDLDHNGIAEVWLMYKIDCAGDVSPVPMKIIMHQGALKYAMRGSSKVVINGRNYGGGAYTFDDAFNKAPDSFKQHARLLWSKNLMEHFQQP